MDPRVRAALEPFVRYRNDWLFHYPVYLNTFCFTYDLAVLLSGVVTTKVPDALGGNFQRHDWWLGLPKFTYRRDIEIFTAVKRTIDGARTQGHDIRREHIVRFTRYDIKSVFVRKRPGTPTQKRNCLLVTDLPQNAEELVDTWAVKAPPWFVQQFGGFRLTRDHICLSFQRELHDLFAGDDKIYIFSAPLAYQLKKQSSRTNPKAKYIEQKAGIRPVDTFFVFRCNSGVDPQRIRDLRAAVASYYDLLFSSPQIESLLHPKVAWEYGRIASTVGQPHPFPEVHEVDLRKGPRPMDLRGRYAEILANHHRY